jgi:hypothetical protein
MLERKDENSSASDESSLNDGTILTNIYSWSLVKRT